MRLLLVLIALALIAGCAGSQPYSQLDLRQVESAYSTIKPIYISFKAAYARNDLAAMGRILIHEHQACRQVDVIDARDTIDPNTNLFQASAALDSFCNAMESAYNSWREAHGMSYDKNLPAATEGAVFAGSDLNMLKMSQWLREPAALY